MDLLEILLGIFSDLQEDESIDLSNYAERFVEAHEIGQQLVEQFETFEKTSAENEQTISELKNSNWDLSKKITKADDIEDEVPEDETPEDDGDDEVEYETVDDALSDLFKQDDEEEK